MSVEIDPLELNFERPFTTERSQILKIKNLSTLPIAFKVKTTAPKQYCVRPNSGRIEPGHDVEVSVLLQAFKQEPTSEARCRDKFLVQSVPITGDKLFTNVAQIWDSVVKTDVEERKIRVNWLSADSGRPGAAATPIRRPLTNGAEAVPETAQPLVYSSPNENVHQYISTYELGTPEIKYDPQEDTMAGSVISASSKAATTTGDELKEQLIKAEATIASLKDELASGLRQRQTTAASANEKASMPGKGSEAPGQQLSQAVRQGTEGVPVHLVAALCLVSFLLAYFFF